MSDKKNRNSVIALVGAIVIVLFVLVGIALNLFPETATVFAFLAPVLATLFGVAGLRAEVGAVQEQVNGNFTALADENRELRKTVSALLASMSPQQAREVVDTGAIPIIQSNGSETR